MVQYRAAFASRPLTQSPQQQQQQQQQGSGGLLATASGRSTPNTSLSSHSHVPAYSSSTAAPHPPQQAAQQQQYSPLPQLRIPGALIVSQGSPGDGMRNSLTEPVPVWRDLIRAHAAAADGEASVASSSLEADNDTAASSSCVVTTLPPQAWSHHLQHGQQQEPTSAATHRSAASSATAQRQSLHPELQAALELWQEESKSRQLYKYKEWKDTLNASTPQTSSGSPSAATQSSRLNSQATQQSATTFQSAASQSNQNNNNNNNNNNLPPRWMHQTSTAWWRCRGQLAVLSHLPDGSGSQQQQQRKGAHKAVAALAPGTVVHATELYAWHGQHLQPVKMMPTATTNNNQRGGFGIPYNTMESHRGIAWIIKIDQPVRGYCCYSLDGYPLCLPVPVIQTPSSPIVSSTSVNGPPLQQPAQGHASIAPYVNDPARVWFWRVTCPAGAFVREGLELTTRHVATLPYGTLVMVVRQRVNQAGLPRLQIVAHMYEQRTVSHRRVLGWCSTALNPLSGQRGHILQPLPMPRPVVYRVVLPQGAVIRQDVELASPEVGHAPAGAWVTVIAQAFSDFPADRAVVRLRLAGGGWISARLNHAAPRDLPVVEYVGEDAAFSPSQAALFHYHAQRQAVVLQLEAQQELAAQQQAQQQQQQQQQLQHQMANRYQESTRRQGSSGDLDMTPAVDDSEGSYTLLDTGGGGGAAGGVGGVRPVTAIGVSTSSASVATPVSVLTTQTPALSVNGAGARPPNIYKADPASAVSGLAGSVGGASASGAGSTAGTTTPNKNLLCLCCIEATRDATLVHGETGHIVCCLQCARILQAQGAPCPVCRLPIEKVIKHYYG